LDYSEIGLKVGLEIHQQLRTKEKLFCSCKPSLFKGDPEITFLRRLRPTQSELGQVDPAALFEFKKGVMILYEANKETSCLVEMDEEPPHELNPEAVETSLIVALMMNSKPVDEIHVMRKTVIDGSNTTGFQRTCIVSLGGEIRVAGKRIPIQHVGLEEDAARKMRTEGKIVHYRIDRLGIPLIEVATAPVIYSPKEAEEVALAIGKILRATGKVRRGLGTIRQDLNISISKGALIEIKGVQELALVSKAVEYEVKRQLKLLEIKEELMKRGVREESLTENFIDVTQLFQDTKCRVIREALKKGCVVLAVKLAGFAGLLGEELAPNLRFGTELADIARFWGRVGGLFHTDELPKYGITEAEVKELRRVAEAGDGDAVVFVADSRERAEDALRAVVKRAREALKGVPQDTRMASPEGTSRYMRPRPGAARMYPETDVPPIKITEEYIDELRSRLPEMPEEKAERFARDYKLNRKLVRQLLDSDYAGLFEEIIGETGVSPTLVAVTLTETLKSIEREGVDISALDEEKIKELFHLVKKGATTKEAIPPVLSWLSKNPNKRVAEALEELGLKMLSTEALKSVISEIMEKNRDLIKERGIGAFGVLMGQVMKKVRGRAEATVVSDLLKRLLKEQRRS